MIAENIPSLTPLTPPKSEDDRLDWLRLLRSRRVGIATFFRLMSGHGSAAAALAALPQVAAQAGVRDYATFPEKSARAELRAGARVGARLLAFGEPDYPRALYDLGDPPPLLWARGRIELLRRPCVALVGARNASSLGTRMARSLATDLGRQGCVVVSGLARGVDAAAHAASLPGGTVAVMAGGLDIFYPAENTDLARQIGETGLLLSEQPMGLQPQARHFPQRNRLISGLSRAVVVVEAAARSGSLITARDALDQGREVLAVPGHPFDARAAGCNMLIRDGATLLRSVADLAEALGPLDHNHCAEDSAPEPAVAPRPAAASDPDGGVSDLQQRILDRLGPSPTAEDQLIRDLALPPGQVAPLLVELELDGRIERRAGGLLALANLPDQGDRRPCQARAPQQSAGCD